MADVSVPAIAAATVAAGDTILGVQAGAVRRFPVSQLALPGDIAVEENKRLASSASSRGGVVAFVFDDGYQSNYVNALPLFRKYGFAATLAIEIDKVSTSYGSDPAYPVCTPANLREMVDAGWEICNHPNLNLADSEAQMVTAARAENQLLVDYLTGAKVAPGGAPGGVTHPQYLGYRVETAVLRGGARNATSDAAYRFLFDKVRSIAGAVASRGDYLHSFARHQERRMGCTAYVVDTTNRPLQDSLAFIESVAQTGAQAIIYAHDTPLTVVGITPYILASELETLLKRCHELGVAVVPLGYLYRGNAVYDKSFENSTGSFTARTGDTAAFTTSDTLHGAARAVELVSSAGVANDVTQYTTRTFVCEPFCRYKVSIRYKIDVALTLVGGTGNRNHGLNVTLLADAGNTAGDSAGLHLAREMVLNDAAARLPYDVTTGYGTYEVTLCTGYGSQASVRVSLINCTGAIKIGAIYAEKGESLLSLPLSGVSTFNASLGRQIYLPDVAGSGARGWKWRVEVSAAAIASAATYDYAFADPANIAAPTAGQTCYVIGTGVGAFATHSGKLATYNGTTWSFAVIAPGTFFKVNNCQGTLNVYIRHMRSSTEGAPQFEISKTALVEDAPFFFEADEKVYNASGLRTDAFSWCAYPVPNGFA